MAAKSFKQLTMVEGGSLFILSQILVLQYNECKSNKRIARRVDLGEDRNERFCLCGAKWQALGFVI